ncbi:MAG: OB-fold domain-containing protein [Agathobacter sp.]
MMKQITGIISYGAYVPTWRIDKRKIAADAGNYGAAGQRSFAARDEDSITMAVEACVDCLRGLDAQDIDGLIFATTTCPLVIKHGAGIIAGALGLKEDVFVTDVTDSTRALVSAIRLAESMVKSEMAKKVLVVSAEHCVGRPGSKDEENFGDAAVAFLMGNENVIATIFGGYGISNPIPGMWMRRTDKYPQSFDGRFEKREDTGSIVNVIKKTLTNLELESKDITKYAIALSDSKSIKGIAKKCGFDEKAQVAKEFIKEIGNCGTAQCGLSLIDSLEHADADQVIMCVSVGDGAESIVFKTTDALISSRGVHMGTKYVYSTRDAFSYGQFAHWQGTKDTGWPPDDMTASVPMYYRDSDSALAFKGMKCPHCGTLQYPIGRICVKCRKENEETKTFETVDLAKTGKIFTFTHDTLYAHGCMPGDGKPYTRAIVDLDDGCRVYAEIVDCSPEEIAVGTPVECTFRCIHSKGGYNFYGWRMRTIRKAKEMG